MTEVLLLLYSFTYLFLFLGLLHSVKKQDLVRKYVYVMETIGQLCEQESEKVVIFVVVVLYFTAHLGSARLSVQTA